MDEPDLSKRWNDLYYLVGQMSLAFNSCNWMAFEAFRIIMGIEREDATPIFYSLKSDTGQREMTLSVIDDRLTQIGETELLAEFKREFDAIGKVSGIRNGFIHTPWSMEYGPEGRFRPAHGATPHKKVNYDDPLGQAEETIQTMYDIRVRLIRLCDQLEEIPSLRKLNGQSS